MLGLLQSGWAFTQAQPREVRMTYWELVPEIEIWVRLIPENADGNPPLVNLVFHAFYPGRADRNPYSGHPRWPTGPPARLTVSAEPLPRTVIRELSLQLVVDGRAIDLTGFGRRYRNIPCLVYTDDCAPSGVEADIEPLLLRSLVAARSVDGRALGFAIRLTKEDRAAVTVFASRVGLGRP